MAFLRFDHDVCLHMTIAATAVATAEANKTMSAHGSLSFALTDIARSDYFIYFCLSCFLKRNTRK